MPLPMSHEQSTTASVSHNTSASVETCHISIPLSLTPHTRLQIQIQHKNLATPLIFITTTSYESNPRAALGSFVYALPNRLKPSEPLCTTLYGGAGTVDFATRVAKILAQRRGQPTYVGWSGELGGIGRQVEEEMEGLRGAVDAILKVLGGEAIKHNGIV